MEDLAIVIEARALTHYGLGRATFHGGTEEYIQRLAAGLGERGHEVHVVTPDLTHMERRGPNVFYWPPLNHPTAADVLVAVPTLEGIGEYSAPFLVLASNGLIPIQPEMAALVSGVACFSQVHADLLTARVPGLTGRTFVTGLGVNLGDYAAPHKPVHGRMLWANDPTRGLWHLLDIFDAVKRRVPEATLHVAYDFDRQFEPHRWRSHALAEILWECKRRIESTPGVTSLGALTREQVIAEQMACHVHAMPSDPQNVGSQIHGMLQMELAAAGVPLVLSNIEAFPEVFGEVAEILPLPNALAKGGDMVQRFTAEDWAEVVAGLMMHPRKWKAASAASRRLAEQHTWEAMLDRWEAMFEALIAERKGGLQAAA